MDTRVIFNTDQKLKTAALRKARNQGTTLSTVLHLATKAYVDNRFEVDVLGQMIEKARGDARAGRLYTEKEVYRKLGVKSK